MQCRICPRRCGADRSKTVGFCGAGDSFLVARAALHRWEEPCIGGEKGAGAIFFGGCNLKCIFCQNERISHVARGRRMEPKELVALFKQLQQQGAQTIDLVNPTHYTSQLYEVLKKDKPSIPVVWNSGGYECVESLRMMRGLVDVYLPDIKYFDSEKSFRYAGVRDYFSYASAAVQEMVAQTGPAVFDENGILLRGTLIRHLVLPANTRQAMQILDWISETLPKGVLISLMCQYIPVARAAEAPELNRRLKRWEYRRVVDYACKLGLTDGYVQEFSSASGQFVPVFDWA